jgi:hypothetical protein
MSLNSSSRDRGNHSSHIQILISGLNRMTDVGESAALISDHGKSFAAVRMEQSLNLQVAESSLSLFELLVCRRFLFLRSLSPYRSYRLALLTLPASDSEGLLSLSPFPLTLSPCSLCSFSRSATTRKMARIMRIPYNRNPGAGRSDREGCGHRAFKALPPHPSPSVGQIPPPSL